MAETVVPQCNQGYSINQQQSGINRAFVVVNEQPIRREVFPYRLQIKWILVFSIFKCMLGTLLIIAGIVNVFIVKYNTKIGIPILCALIVIANGSIGCTLKCKQTKCLVGAFLALSITSIIFSVSMLSFYPIVLEYFANVNRLYCNHQFSYWGGYTCRSIMPTSEKHLGIGMTSFLIVLAVLELACSIGSVAVSCKAYSKCCNTCNANDSCTCVGCCECDCTPLNTQQGAQLAAPPYHNYQNFQMSSVQPIAYELNQQHTENSPSSSYVTCIPSYVVSAVNGTQLSSFDVHVQPTTSKHQVPLIRQAEQVQGAINAACCDSQPYSTPTK